MSLLYPYHNKNKPILLLKIIVEIACLMNEGTRRTTKELNYWLNHLNSSALIGKAIENSSTVVNKELTINNINSITNLVSTFIKPAIEIDLNFIIGIIIGDGSFFVSFSKNRKYKFGFNITTDIKDFLTLLKIKNKLNCGRLYIKSKTWCRFEIDSINDLNKVIIPLIESLDNKNLILGAKAKNYLAFKESLELHNNNLTNTNEGFKSLVTKIYNIHDEGRKRKYSMEQYLKMNNLH